MSHIRTSATALAVALFMALLLAAAPQLAFAGGEDLAAGEVAAAQDQETAAAEEAPSVKYRVMLSKWQAWKSDNAKAGKAGKGKRVRNLAIKLDTGNYTGGIKYRVRLAGGKWKAWKKNGKAIGTLSNIEAVQIKLTGAIAKSYDVVYRTYVTKVGWQARVMNGGIAGTGKGRKIEALKVQLVKKSARSGWLSKSGKWSYYKAGKKVKGQWVQTTESPINVMTTKSHDYWLDTDGTLAVKRVVDPSATSDADAGHVAYATKWGYALRSAKAKTAKGYVLANSKGVLSAKTGWLKTTKYDDITRWYYLESAGAYSVAKIGLFKVGKRQYYGLPDEGYVMRNQTMKVNKKWYTADEEGVLGPATSTETHIERYVQWAINIANDDKHGYSQAVRWGPDYDCSSLVISSLKNTGLSAGSAVYTGNMKSELTSQGFKWHTDFSKLKRGDILLVHNAKRQHTEIYIGDGKTVGAHIAETGGIYGVIGDQTGKEICIAPYTSIWEGYLRFGS